MGKQQEKRKDMSTSSSEQSQKRLKTTTPRQALADASLQVQQGQAINLLARNATFGNKGLTEHILSFLPKEDLRAATLVNRTFHSLVSQTPEAKLEALRKVGRDDIQVLQQGIPTAGQELGTYDVSTPLQQQLYAAHRVNQNSAFVNITTRHDLFVGPAVFSIDMENGHYIVPTGVEKEGLNDPAADYEQFFLNLANRGQDENMAPLYRLATGLKKEDPVATSEVLDDRRAAAILYYCLSNDADKTHELLGEKRTQLTEDIAKFTAIVAISERARSYKNASNAYDATLLVKAGLYFVMNGLQNEATKKPYSLEDIFYKGKGGCESVFLGGPSAKNSPAKIGGAEQLANPLAHQEALKRQMDLFPDPTWEFRKFYASLGSTAKAVATPATAKELADALKQKQEEQLAQSKALHRLIKAEKGPSSVYGVNDFVNDKAGMIPKTRSRIASLRKHFAGNLRALAELQAASSTLDALQDKVVNLRTPLLKKK